MRIVRAAIVGGLFSIVGLVACTSSTGTGGALTCTGGNVIATCSLGNVACVEYGGDWSMSEAQQDCDSVSGWTFVPNTMCAHSGPTLYGACLAPTSNGKVQRAYDPSATASGQLAVCDAVAGTWCPITPTGGGTPPVDSGELDATEDATVLAEAGVDAKADAHADAGMDAAVDARADGESPADAGDASVDAADAAAHDASEDAGDAASADAEVSDAISDASADGD